MKFCGKKTKHGLVVIIAAEGGDGIAKRIRAWEIKYGCIAGEKLIIVPHAVVPTNEKHRKELTDMIRSEATRQGLALVLLVVDTMSQCSNGMAENDAGGVSLYLQACNTIAQEFGATCINIHHPKKANDEFRGSSTILNNVDFLLSMKRNKSSPMFTDLTNEKLKEGENQYKCRFELERLEIGVFDEDGEPISTLFVKHEELIPIDPFSIETSGSKKASSTPQRLTDALWLTNHLTNCPGFSASLKSIKEQMVKDFSLTDMKHSAMRVSRAKEDLVSQSKITSTKNGNQVFITLADTERAEVKTVA